MKKRTSNIRVIKLDAHKPPQFKEVKGKDYIAYGNDKDWKNRYPDYLLHLYNRSAKHNAIVNGKADYIFGNGWAVDEKGLNTLNLAKLQKFLNEPNPNETLDELTHKCILDIEIYGGFALEIIYSRTGTISEIHHADFRRYRVSKEGDVFHYHDTWKGRIKEEDIETIPAFDPEKKVPKQLLYVKTYHPECDYYPLPQYLGCVPYIEIDSEIANFHYNAIKQGFMGGTIFQFFNGQPTEEEMADMEDLIEDKFCGTDNANKIMLLFSDSREQGMEISEPRSNDFDKRYEILNKTTEQEIYGGHRIVDPSLFGIKEEGIFTNRSQIRDSYELFKNTYVNGRQRFVERVFNNLLAFMGFSGRLQLTDVEPISEGYSEATKVSVMTTDEIRAELGLEPLADTQIKAEIALSNQAKENVLHSFDNIGLSLDEYEIVKPLKEVGFTSQEEAERDEQRVYSFGTDDPFTMAVLQAFKDNPQATYQEIATALNSTVENVASAVTRLETANYITRSLKEVVDTPQRTLEVTKGGSRALEQAEPLEAVFKIAYRYVKRQEASGSDVIDTTRDFCKEMVAKSKNRVWTAKQITDISFKEGRNVWLRAGGFWTRKGTNTTTPYCRHTWEQVVVKPKEITNG